jgi:hypothetical protein
MRLDSYGLVLACVAILVLSAAPALPNPVAVMWFDDMEGDVSQWWSADLTASAVPHFHLDGYLAYDGDYSWWCGNFDYDTDGGYGNAWDDRLELPPISVNPSPVENVSWGAIKALFADIDSDGAAGDGPGESAEPAEGSDESQGHRRGRDPVYPILTFAFRHDSEPAYDYTYVQAESNGVYVNLNRGYDGVQPWTDIGPYGFDLSACDDPLRIRFRFISDGAWSDEDGLYFSDGGAFHVDNIKVYDFTTGDVLFYDDGESGGLCTPAVPGAAGDYWHLIDRACPALSDPHSWWCGDDADTSLVPPNLQDALFTPLTDLEGVYSCTCCFAIHLAVPTVDMDYVEYRGTVNGVDYYSLGGWWGDFGQCSGWGSTAYSVGFDIGQFGTGPLYGMGGMAFVMYTTENGCGPGGGGDAGVMIDDFLLFGGMSHPLRNPDLSEGIGSYGSGDHVKLLWETSYTRGRQ